MSKFLDINIARSLLQPHRKRNSLLVKGTLQAKYIDVRIQQNFRKYYNIYNYNFCIDTNFDLSTITSFIITNLFSLLIYLMMKQTELELIFKIFTSSYYF